MTILRVPTEHVIDMYLRWYAETHAPSTGKIVRMHLSRFHRSCRRRWWDEVSRADINRWLESLSDASRWRATSCFRSFVRWANSRLGSSVYAPPAYTLGRPRRLDSGERRANYLLERVRQHAQKLGFPHQRLLFLCGFLYGLRFEAMRRMQVSDFLALQPMHSGFYELLVEVDALGRSSGRPLLEPWLGKHRRTAMYRWKEWTGGLRYREVVKAGELQRIRLGRRPFLHQLKGELGLLPPLDEVTMERMPTLWLDSRKTGGPNAN